jgi:DNA-binding NarL/FixJ family response regulator
MPFPSVAAPAVEEPPVPETKIWQVLVVDDHPIFRHGVSQLIGTMPEVHVCGEADSAAVALEMMRRLKPDLALVDVSMPGTNGIELIKLMLAERPRLTVLVVSMHEESLYALRALRAGALGYVMKHQALDNIIGAMRKVMGGGIYVSPEFSERLVFKAVQAHDTDFGLPVDKLSDRELEVLQYMGRGKSTREIAQKLHLSIKTIETHRTHIKEKLGFRTAEEMLKFAGEWVMISEG